MISEIIWCTCLLGCIGLALHCAARCCHLSEARRAVSLFGASPWLPRFSGEPLPDGEEVSFTTSDGLTLRGSYLRASSARREGVVLCCHELNGSRWTMRPMIESLRLQGFDVFAFDQRNHGASDANPQCPPTPLVSRDDVNDLRRAIDYVSARPDADGRGVGLVGVSKGALTALFVAADDPRVRGVVVDSACLGGRLPPFLKKAIPAQGRGIAEWLGELRDGMGRLTDAWRRLMLGWWCGCHFVDLQTAVHRLEKPILWIQGERDPFLRFDPAMANPVGQHDRCRFWLVHGADHGEAIEVAGPEYGRRVSCFLARHLTPRPEFYAEPVYSMPAVKPVAALRKA